MGVSHSPGTSANLTSLLTVSQHALLQGSPHTSSLFQSAWARYLPKTAMMALVHTLNTYFRPDSDSVACHFIIHSHPHLTDAETETLGDLPRSHCIARLQLEQRLGPSSVFFPTSSKIYTRTLDAFPEAWVLSKRKLLPAKTLGSSGEDLVRQCCS